MDILIKGMEMPSCCGNCQFNQFHEANPWTTWETCRILDKNTDDIGEGRLADCPLVALTEHHGRLGDLDALQKQIEDDIETVAKEKGKVGLRELWQILNKNIENAPVIVEATE